MEQIYIREAVTEADRERVFRLRYLIFIKEEGLSTPEQPAKSEMIEDAADREATLFLAKTSEGEAVGTVGLAHGQLAADLLKSRYSIPDRLLEPFSGRLGYGFWLGVKRSHAHRVFNFPEMDNLNNTIAIALSIKAFMLCTVLGVELSFITTKPSFRHFFERLGFICYQEDIMHPYWHQPRSLMALLMNDIDRFRLGNSPLLRYAAPTQDSPRLIQAFKNQLSQMKKAKKQAGGLA